MWLMDQTANGVDDSIMSLKIYHEPMKISVMSFRIQILQKNLHCCAADSVPTSSQYILLDSITR